MEDIPRLGIVIPYRNRPVQFKRFIPHLCNFFTRNSLNHQIPYRAIIVEQADGKPYNGGMLKNIGFELCRDSCDYVCFHDIDFLPIQTNYGWVDRPTAVRIGGFRYRKIPITSELGPQKNFGGVVFIGNTHFGLVNGYANDYWGWGFEDTDLRMRLERQELEIGQREGNYLTLNHPNRGSDKNNLMNAIGQYNFVQFTNRWSTESPNRGLSSGLSDLSFDLVKEENLAIQGMYHAADWKVVKVSLNVEPSKACLSAMALDQKKRESQSPPSPKSFTGSQFS